MIYDILKRPASDMPVLFRRALTLANRGKPASYERLEFLGDRVLGMVVAEMLYRHFPQENEGDWAMRFTLLVREETLADVARQIGIPPLLITDDVALRDNNSILADVMEALIAAAYLDLGIVKVKRFIEDLWRPLLNRSYETIKDAKSALQELTQRELRVLPEYTQISRTGPDHAPHFVIKVSVPKYGEATGEGHSKKEAMQAAAGNMLSIIQKADKETVNKGKNK